jgi:transmembrane sensor
MTHIERELLRRYLSGDSSPEEAERVEAWLAEDPDRWSELAKLDQERADEALSQAAVERAGADVWARLRKAVSDEAALGELQHIRQPRGTRRIPFAATSSRWTTGLQIAAALVLAAGAGTAMAVWLRSRHAVSVPAVRVAATAPGERATFRLRDGTSVMLGVASTLRYPVRFGEGTREVSVEGEAYFDVVHDARRPFVVRAGQLVAKDLGTQFTVRFYPDDAGARVVVREGRVAIRASQGRQTTVVSPGQEGRLSPVGAVALTTADTTAAFAWIAGRLVLRDVPLREALPDLGRWFDLEFRLADSGLGDIPLTVSLTSRPTPTTLRTLAAALGLELSQADSTVTLRAAPQGQ